MGFKISFKISIHDNIELETLLINSISIIIHVGFFFVVIQHMINMQVIETNTCRTLTYPPLQKLLKS